MRWEAQKARSIRLEVLLMDVLIRAVDGWGDEEWRR
jgi:hypothetical protein